MPKRYLFTYTFNELIRNFYESLNEASEISEGEIFDGDAENNPGFVKAKKIKYRLRTIEVRLAKPLRAKLNSGQQKGSPIGKHHNLYWYLAKIIEQEIVNRNKLTRLINIISSEEKFNISQ
jgi:hypothetical protein